MDVLTATAAERPDLAARLNDFNSWAPFMRQDPVGSVYYRDPVDAYPECANHRLMLKLDVAPGDGASRRWITRPSTSIVKSSRILAARSTACGRVPVMPATEVGPAPKIRVCEGRSHQTPESSVGAESASSHERSSGSS